ncbi:hypothetical protein GCM10025776_10280 [Corallincola platygyrae]
MPMAIVGIVLAGASALLDSPQMLKFYPVVVNLCMFAVFAYSLYSPPSMIERLARLREPELPNEAIQYTRKVTWIWVAFFVLNGMVALWTATYASMATWTLYNGLIAYFMMGVLLVGEICYRRWVLRVN